MCGHPGHLLETFSALEMKANGNALNYLQRQLSSLIQGPCRLPGFLNDADLAESASTSFSALHLTTWLPPLGTEAASFHWPFEYFLQSEGTDVKYLYFCFHSDLNCGGLFTYPPHVFTPLFYTYTYILKRKLLEEKGWSLSYCNLINIQRRGRLVLENKYRYPPLFKSSHFTTSLLWKTYGTLGPVFADCKKYDKKWQIVKITFGVWFAAALPESAYMPSSQWPRWASSQGTAFSIWTSGTIVLNCEYLGFISIYFVHLLARCVLR